MWTLFQGITTFMKISALTMLRHQGGRTLVWAGSITQISAFLGAVIVFAIVNCTQLFVASDLNNTSYNNGSN